MPAGGKQFGNALAFVIFASLFAPHGGEAKSFKVLHTFRGNDGSEPLGNLIRDRHGNLYGTTALGGEFNNGAVFKLAPDGTEQVLYSFSFFDGGSPQAGLVRDAAGNLYGTTEQGSGAACECGSVFKLAPDGTETVLHAFGNTDGAYPIASLIRRGGDFYGTTFGGGNDGAFPRGGLVHTRSGKLFGVTEGGGDTQSCVPLGCGTVFWIAADGTETIPHSFTVDDGVNPVAALIDDGRYLYGTSGRRRREWHGLYSEEMIAGTLPDAVMLRT